MATSLPAIGASPTAFSGIKVQLSGGASTVPVTSSLRFAAAQTPPPAGAGPSNRRKNKNQQQSPDDVIARYLQRQQDPLIDLRSTFDLILRDLEKGQKPAAISAAEKKHQESEAVLRAQIAKLQQAALEDHASLEAERRRTAASEKESSETIAALRQHCQALQEELDKRIAADTAQQQLSNRERESEREHARLSVELERTSRAEDARLFDAQRASFQQQIDALRAAAAAQKQMQQQQAASAADADAESKRRALLLLESEKHQVALAKEQQLRAALERQVAELSYRCAELQTERQRLEAEMQRMHDAAAADREARKQQQAAELAGLRTQLAASETQRANNAALLQRENASLLQSEKARQAALDALRAENAQLRDALSDRDRQLAQHQQQQQQPVAEKEQQKRLLAPAVREDQRPAKLQPVAAQQHQPSLSAPDSPAGKTTTPVGGEQCECEVCVGLQLAADEFATGGNPSVVKAALKRAWDALCSEKISCACDDSTAQMNFVLESYRFLRLCTEYGIAPADLRFVSPRDGSVLVPKQLAD